MAVAISITEKYPYILLADRKLKKSEQTIFFLRRLSGIEYYAILEQKQNEKGMDVEQKDKKGNIIKFKMNFDFGSVMDGVKVGLVDWENFKNIKGQERKFNKKNIVDSINEMQIPDIQELYHEIISGSQLLKVEAKNSK